jgi:hypothetical protein
VEGNEIEQDKINHRKIHPKNQKKKISAPRKRIAIFKKK